MAVLARPANGFRYRTDEAGNTTGTAATLAQGGTQVSGSGIVTTINDIDFWSFTTGAGSVSLNVAVTAGANNLDAKAQLVDATGNVIVGWQDPATSFGTTITATVAAGSYHLIVGSHGAYGDVGQYSISGTIVGTGETPLLGDCDLDGDVDFHDAFTLSNNYGTSSNATWGMGDFDLDGDVDFVDASVQVNNYGSSFSATSAPSNTSVSDSESNAKDLLGASANYTQSALPRHFKRSGVRAEFASSSGALGSERGADSCLQRAENTTSRPRQSLDQYPEKTTGAPEIGTTFPSLRRVRASEIRRAIDAAIHSLTMSETDVSVRLV
jgi:hypothetical protein